MTNRAKRLLAWLVIIWGMLGFIVVLVLFPLLIDGIIYLQEDYNNAGDWSPGFMLSLTPLYILINTFILFGIIEYKACRYLNNLKPKPFQKVHFMDTTQT